MLLLHCWYILTCRFNTKTAGLMPLMARMSGGPYEKKMDTLKRVKESCYKHISSLALVICNSVERVGTGTFLFYDHFQMVALK